MKARKNIKGLLKESVYEFEKEMITRVYKENNQNQVKTARILGINRNTLRGRLMEYGVLGGSAPKETVSLAAIHSNNTPETLHVADDSANTLSFSK